MFETINTDSNPWPYIIWAQGYIVYLIMVICCNKTRKYLSNIKSHSEYETIYYNVKNTPGHFVFHVQCYHYEDRVSHHTVRDSNGNTRT
jgi:hypothetical protein